MVERGTYRRSERARSILVIPFHQIAFIFNSSWFTVMQIILNNQTSYLLLRKLYLSWTLDSKMFLNYYLLINIDEKIYTNEEDTEVWWLVFIISEPRLLVFGRFTPIHLPVVYWVCYLQGAVNSNCKPCAMVKNKKMNGMYFLYWVHSPGGEIRHVVPCNINSLR